MRSTVVAAGDEALATQYNNLRKDAYGGSMLLVHEQTSPNMTVYVEPGVAYVGNTRVKYLGGNSPTITAPVTNPRIDLITIDSSGTIGVTAGAEGASPSVPAYPDNKVVLAEIYLRVSSTTIVDTDTGSGAYIYADVRPVLGGSYISAAGQIAAGIITAAKLTDAARHLSDIYAASSGGSDTYAITLTTAPSAYVTGQIFAFKADVANTGAATLNVNSLGAVTIKKNGGASDLATGDIAAGQVVVVQYDGTNFQMLSALSQPTAQIAAGTLTDVASTTAADNDEVATCGFTPKLIILTYYIQAATGFVTPQVEKGVAFFTGTTFVFKHVMEGGTAADNVAADTQTNDGYSTSALQKGAAVDGGARITVTVPSTSSTGFTCRRKVEILTNPSTARAKIGWVAIG